MAEFTVEKMDLTGLSPTMNSANSGGDYFRNEGKTFIKVENSDTGSHTVTLNLQKTFEVNGVTVSLTNPTVDIPAGEFRLIGPFDKDWFNDADQYTHIDYDAVTSVTVGVVKL